jgi:YegS/Rv2252/BmrU family lipid kinase
VVVNPLSRFPRDAVERELRRQAPTGTLLEVRETDRARSIREILDDSIADLSMVVAVGGDGTVSDVATALTGTMIPLGIIPGGTTNMVAKVNRVPGKLETAVSLLFGRHRIETIDVGRSNGKSLLHIGGSGLDARIFERSDQSLKRKIGWLAYAPPMLPALNEPASRYTVTVDGNTIVVPSRLILIVNSGSLISARFSLFPQVSRQDGLFNVMIFTADSALPIASSVAGMLTLGRIKGSHLIELAGKEILINADPPMPFELDGDLVGTTPFRVVVEPAALNVICGEP